MKMLKRLLRFISFGLLSALFAAAADLSGVITFKSKPLAGAVVTANLIGQAGSTAVTVTRTGLHGEYRLNGLRSGNYIVFVDVNGRRIYQGMLALINANLVKNIALD